MFHLKNTCAQKLLHWPDDPAYTADLHWTRPDDPAPAPETLCPFLDVPVLPRMIRTWKFLDIFFSQIKDFCE